MRRMSFCTVPFIITSALLAINVLTSFQQYFIVSNDQIHSLEVLGIVVLEVYSKTEIVIVLDTMRISSKNCRHVNQRRTMSFRMNNRIVNSFPVKIW